MIQRTLFRRCAATVESTAAAAASPSSATATATTPRRRKLYIDKRKELYGMRVMMGGIVALTYLAVQYVTKRVHTEHQFIPVYNEAGDLEGFTHPALVQAADRIREKSK